MSNQFHVLTPEERQLLVDLALCASCVYYPKNEPAGQSVLDQSGSPLVRVAQGYFQGIGGGWRTLLVKNTDTGALFVAIEGTTPEGSNKLFNWVENFFVTAPTSMFSKFFKACLWIQANTLGRWGMGMPPDAVQEVEEVHGFTWTPNMADQVVEWQATHGKIHAVIGHSAGGFYASRIGFTLGLRPVTFNALDPVATPGAIHLRLRGDQVSRFSRAWANYKYDTLQIPESKTAYTGHSMDTVVAALNDDAVQLKKAGSTSVEGLAELRKSLPGASDSAASGLCSPREEQIETSGVKRAAIVASAAALGVCGGCVGCYIVNAVAQRSGLDSEEEHATASGARAGAAVGGALMVVGVMGFGSATGCSSASVQSGVVAVGQGSLALGLAAVFFVPCATAIVGGFVSSARRFVLRRTDEK